MMNWFRSMVPEGAQVGCSGRKDVWVRPQKQINNLATFSPPQPCGLQDLSSPSAIEPMPLALKAGSPNHWTAREFPSSTLFFKLKDASDLGVLTFPFAQLFPHHYLGAGMGLKEQCQAWRPLLWVKGAKPAEMALVGPQLQTFLKPHVPSPWGTHLDYPGCGSRQEEQECWKRTQQGTREEKSEQGLWLCLRIKLASPEHQASRPQLLHPRWKPRFTTPLRVSWASVKLL